MDSCESCGATFGDCGCGETGSCKKCEKHTKGKKVYCGSCFTRLARTHDLPFDVAEYDRVRGPVVDAFEYNRGGVKVSIDKGFLDSVCDNHNTKFSRTGSLSPLVIGHTVDGAKEHDQPQKVGYLHNWATEPWVNPQGVNTHAAFADHWIKKENTVVVSGHALKLSAKEVLERWPRRSGEVWFGTKEIDPHCLLGATAPERDLGILRLSPTGDSGITYTSPGKLSMADETMPSANELPIVKTMESQVQQLSQAVEAIQEAAQMITQGAQAMQAAMAALSQGGGGEEQGNHEQDFEDLLKQLNVHGGEGEGEGDPDQQPEPEPAPAQPAKMSRETEMKPDANALKVKELQRELDVIKLSKRIDAIRAEKGVDINSADVDLINDLLAMPEDMQNRSLLRLEKGPKVAGFAPKSLDEALQDTPASVVKKTKGPEDTSKILKLAREKGIAYEEAAHQLGFAPGL